MDAEEALVRAKMSRIVEDGSATKLDVLAMQALAAEVHRLREERGAVDLDETLQHLANAEAKLARVEALIEAGDTGERVIDSSTLRFALKDEP